MESLWTPPSFLPSLLCSRSLASSIEPPSIDRVYMDTSFLGIRGPRDLDSALEYPDKHTAINAVTLPSRSLFSRSTRYFVRDCQLGHEQLLIALFNRFGYISELSPAMYAAYATAACTPTTFTGTNDNDGNDHDPIPWARHWPSPTALPAWLRPIHQPNVIHVCDSPCRILCRRTFYRISQGHVPDALREASFGWIKACAQAFIRSQHNHNAGSNEDGPPLFFNYSRPIPSSPTATTQVIKVWIAQHSSVPELNRFLRLVKPKQAVSTTAASSRDWVIFGEWIARQPGAIECPSRFLGSTRKGIRFSDLQRMMEGRRKSSGSPSVVEVEVEVERENVDPFELALVLSDNEEESASELLSQQSSQRSHHVGLPSALQDTLDIGEWIEQQQRRRRHSHGQSTQDAKALESMFALPPSDDGPEGGDQQQTLAFPTPPPSDRRQQQEQLVDDGPAHAWAYSLSEAKVDELDFGGDTDAGWFESRLDVNGHGEQESELVHHGKKKSVEERVLEHWRDEVHGKTNELLHRLHMALLVQGRQHSCNADDTNSLI
ncbi:hypothetical protein BCR44DRAFT_92920 [Catenaria anguillulae PL171]|uniref:Uncharacterized protein n=1 Tax=Catenaria anguillulae PL171 TaxID=765915 RepID=A0A1Y2H631_9FUNG|nr:hypothetical protein BCR44DRAFT_92920 [Catenaria anguillulae PL171]